MPAFNPMVLRIMRADGWHAESVEHWNAHTHRRQDLFTVVDVLGVGPEGTLAVQATSRGNMASRVHKICECEAFPFMQAAGWRVEVWGFDQPTGKGGRWRLERRLVRLDLDDQSPLSNAPSVAGVGDTDHSGD